jgi:hypothetical protein
MQAATMGPTTTRPKDRGMPRALIQLTVRVEPATYEAALRAAQATGLSLSAWLARVIRERAEQEAARETGEPDASAGPGSPGDAARR